MATWLANQLIIPNNNVQFSEYTDWSNNLLSQIGGGFVQQIEIYGMPGMKLYIGPTLTPEDDIIDKYMILGPSGMFSLNADNDFLLTDIRIAKESYDLLTLYQGGFISFNIISSYAPSQAQRRIVVYNGGGVNTNE